MKPCVQEQRGTHGLANSLLQCLSAPELSEPMSMLEAQTLKCRLNLSASSAWEKQRAEGGYFVGARLRAAPHTSAKGHDTALRMSLELPVPTAAWAELSYCRGLACAEAPSK